MIHCWFSDILDAITTNFVMMLSAFLFQLFSTFSIIDFWYWIVVRSRNSLSQKPNRLSFSSKLTHWLTNSHSSLQLQSPWKVFHICFLHLAYKWKIQPSFEVLELLHDTNYWRFLFHLNIIMYYARYRYGSRR